MPGARRSLPPVAVYTVNRQWRGELFVGLCSGIFGLSAFVARRSLGAPEWIVPLITVAGQLPWILSPAWEPMFARLHPQRAFLWLGLLSKGPLLLVALVAVVPIDGGEGRGEGDAGLFLAAVLLFYLVDGAYIPHRGALLQANLPASVRGRMFGLLSTVALLASILSAKVGGWLLDEDPRWMRVLFPAAAVLGIVGHVFLSRIRWKRSAGPRLPAREPGWRAATGALARAWRDGIALLKEDRAFFLFEAAFMLYGFGLLMSTPLVVLFAEDDLGLSYGDWTTAANLASPLAHLAAVWAIARLSDRIGLTRTTSLAYLLLLVFFALVPFARSAGSLAAAYALLGVSMAGISVGWTLGPLHFAPPGRARQYMSVHVLLVGVRSGTAPFVGYFLAEATSVRAAFWITAGLMALAFLVMSRVGRVRSP
jgi:MFS family permease